MKKRFLRGAVTLLLALSLICADAAAPFGIVPNAEAATRAQINALKQEQSTLNSQKAKLQSELKSLQQSKSGALDQKANLDKQIAVIRSEIQNVEEQIAEYEELIEQTKQELKETEEKEQAQYELFCARVRSMEERGNISYWSVLFHSASFSELLSTADFIEEIMESDQRVIDELQELERQIAEKQEQLETALTEQNEAKDALTARNRELSEQVAAAQRLIDELSANEQEYQKLISEKEREAEAQQQEILRLSRELAAQEAAEAAERARRAAEAAAAAGNSAPTPPATSSGGTKGGYIWPCSSHYVTSPVGSRYTGIRGASTNHAGIDIGRVGYSTTTVAAKAGTVIVSGYNKYRGNYVVVSHGAGNTTTYQHLSKRSVSVGDKVAQGQAVGITGSTGVSSGAHLHFEIMENGVIINPLKYLTDYVKGW